MVWIWRENHGIECNICQNCCSCWECESARELECVEINAAVTAAAGAQLQLETGTLITPSPAQLHTAKPEYKHKCHSRLFSIPFNSSLLNAVLCSHWGIHQHYFWLELEWMESNQSALPLSYFGLHYQNWNKLQNNRKRTSIFALRIICWMPLQKCFCFMLVSSTTFNYLCAFLDLFYP